MPTIEISTDTMQRLQSIATPFTDTPDTVIQRLLSTSAAAAVAAPAISVPTAPGAPIKDDGRTMLFDWQNPPQLAHTTVVQVTLNGEAFAKGDCYWNTIMVRVIKAAFGHGLDANQIVSKLFVNAAIGQKTDNGYKFLPDIGISVQGQDSNGGFRQSFDLAHKMGFKLEVHFRWQNKAEAAFPNKNGVFDL